jgi:ABC-type nitrate/sulfonate/bicarbonate transport system ATPase subunit
MMEETGMESLELRLFNKFVILNEVSFGYDKNLILNKVSIELKKGTSYAIVGKSGAGKSTLLNLVAGFMKPTQGEIIINGEKLIEARKNTGFLFQELGLFPWQTVYETVSMPLKLNGYHKEYKDKEYIKNKVIHLLQDMKLEHVVDKYPSELSGGEKQRVALARTLILEPDLLLMDEPTSSLDPMTKESIGKLIIKGQRKIQSTLLFVTHDIEEAVLLGDKILIMGDDFNINEYENPYSGQNNAKEQIEFYETCIQLRKLLKSETE